LKNARIVGVGGHLPGPAISNSAIAEVAGTLPDDVLDGLQVRTRHWVADLHTGEHAESNSEMAAAAAQAALSSAGLGARDVDLLVVSTSSPEYHLPPMATQVQDRLAISNCTVLDVRSGCAGAVQGLDVARMYVERGDHRIALVIGSEVVSPLLVPIYQGRDPDSVRMRDRIPVYAFGDGAGAMVVQATGDGPSGFLGSAAACVGGGRKPGMWVVGGGTHAPIAAQLKAPRFPELRLDVVESARYTPQVLSEALTAILGACGLTASQVDACVVPEGNAGYLLKELEQADQLTDDWKALAGKIQENLAEVGATGSAAVPLALDAAWRAGDIVPGQTVILLALETSKWIHASVGIRWSAPAPQV
jgi:3-oxoacyl-[acyl-carrier-protein] synthase-3